MIVLCHEFAADSPRRKEDITPTLIGVPGATLRCPHRGAAGAIGAG